MKHDFQSHLLTLERNSYSITTVDAYSFIFFYKYTKHDFEINSENQQSVGLEKVDMGMS